MKIQFKSSEHTVGARIESVFKRVMWINNDRVLYVGLLGTPLVRSYGAWTIYLSLHRPHRICLDRYLWEETYLSVVPPYTPHRIVATERMICTVWIEPETVEAAALPSHLRSRRGAVPTHEVHQTTLGMWDALARIIRVGNLDFSCTEDFDKAFFGVALSPPGHVMDRRISTVVERIKNDPNDDISGEECANAVHLSVSRFLHLFKSEVGFPFRSFRTWKRARSLMYHVTRGTNLVNIALDLGYPDSTHFSHAIRQFYGLTPKSIFAGSRKLALYGGSAVASFRHSTEKSVH